MTHREAVGGDDEGLDWGGEALLPTSKGQLWLLCSGRGQLYTGVRGTSGGSTDALLGQAGRGGIARWVLLSSEDAIDALAPCQGGMDAEAPAHGGSVGANPGQSARHGRAEGTSHRRGDGLVIRVLLAFSDRRCASPICTLSASTAD